jgi:outer membrane protein assembly factor BamB
MAEFALPAGGFPVEFRSQTRSNGGMATQSRPRLTGCLVIPLALRVLAALAFLAARPHASASAAAPEVTNQWVLRVGSYSDSTPAIAPDGTICFGTFDGRLWAVNPDGTQKWVFRAGREIKSSPAVGTDGTIYFGSRDRKFYALTPQGRKRWEFATGAWVDSSPALAKEGTIYFGSWDKKLYALNPQGGELWEYATGGPIVSSPAIGTNGVIYFGSHDGKFYALSSEGVRLWQYATGGPIISSPALAWDGGIYFTSVDGFLYVLNSDGSLRWKLHTTSFREGSPVLGLGGMIFLCSYEGLWAITPEGRQKWYRDNDAMDGTPAIAADGSVIYVLRIGQVINCDHDSGYRWMHYIYPCGSVSPAIGGSGTIYLPGAVNRSLVAIHNTSPLAATPWPKFRGNARNTGNLADSWQ